MQQVCCDHISIFFLGIQHPHNEQVYMSQHVKVFYLSDVVIPLIMIPSSNKSLELASDQRV
jgi:hypothetical protein